MTEPLTPERLAELRAEAEELVAAQVAWRAGSPDGSCTPDEWERRKRDHREEWDRYCQAVAAFRPTAPDVLALLDAHDRLTARVDALEGAVLASKRYLTKSAATDPDTAAAMLILGEIVFDGEVSDG